MGQNPACLVRLLEQTHDLRPRVGERVDRLVASFNQVTVLRNMLVEERQPCGRILVDQSRAVAGTTGQRSRSGDIRRNILDVPCFAFQRRRGRNDARQCLGL